MESKNISQLYEIFPETAKEITILETKKFLTLNTSKYFYFSFLIRNINNYFKYSIKIFFNLNKLRKKCSFCY